MKRWLGLMLVLLMGGVFTAQAALAFEGTIQPFYISTSTIDAKLVIESGKANCVGKVKPTSSTYSTSITVTLQRKVDGAWRKFAAWTDSGKGLSGASVSESKVLEAGYDYRVFVSGTIKDADGTVLESPTKYSTVKSY